VLSKIFGNETAEKVLLHVFHYGQIHASAVAQDHGVALTPVLRQLNRFEEAGVLVSKMVGKSRLYQFNPKSPFAAPVQLLVKIVYESMPMETRESLFGVRRRPRRKGKPVL
jgi:predicted transcriptional regulator